ncbi:MAG: serine/threonine-protein kinase, partial [Polyangiaceae bacterium]
TLNLTANTILANKYKLTRPLGEGGMGCVWVADHLHLDRQVAIKVISNRVMSEPTVRDRFETEARATAKVESPHVVQVLDFDYTESGHPFLVLELLVGETLEQRLSTEGVLSIEDACELLKQTTHALSEAHHSQILHRDIKADNLFLVTKDELFVKLLDFGIAIRSDRASRPDAEVDRAELSPIGTPLYMSPEQTLAMGGVDERSDLYSLAVCMYYALTGDFPYCADTLALLAYAQQKEEFKLPSMLRKELGPAVDAFFLRALAFHAEDRFSSAAKMYEAFSKACERRTEALSKTKTVHAVALLNEPVPTPTRAAIATTIKRSTRRRRRGLSTFVVAAAAAAAGFLLIPRSALPKVPHALSSAAAFVASRLPMSPVSAATEDAPEFSLNRPPSATRSSLLTLPLSDAPATSPSLEVAVAPAKPSFATNSADAPAKAKAKNVAPVAPHDEWPGEADSNKAPAAAPADKAIDKVDAKVDDTPADTAIADKQPSPEPTTATADVPSNFESRK